MRVWGVVVAAGGGERFGGPKQFAMLDGRPLVRWAMDAARQRCDGIVVVVPEGRQEEASAWGADSVAVGGPTRAASVRAGLRAVPENAEVIVVHDGARPLAGGNLFRAVVAEVEAGAEAAVPALAVSDTLKVVSDGSVQSTLSRAGVVAVQTPQAFRAELLRAAHVLEPDATDDAALAEAAGATVRVVPGDPRNLKVTTPADLELVQALVGR